MVTKDDEGYFSMGYKYIDALLVQSIKELETSYQKSVTALKKLATDQASQMKDQDACLKRLQKLL